MVEKHVFLIITKQKWKGMFLSAYDRPKKTISSFFFCLRENHLKLQVLKPFNQI